MSRLPRLRVPDALRRAPDSVRNAWALTSGRGIEPYEPTPSTVVYDEPHRTLRGFHPAGGSIDHDRRPVLLVPPLAVAANCYDLRPGQSLAGFLHQIGLQPYVIDYGAITFADRKMGFEDWIHDIVPTAVQRVSKDHGDVDVAVVGWSLGGTVSVLTAGAHPELPIDSVTALGTPFDYSLVPGPSQARLVGRMTGDRVLSLPPRVMGGVPRHVVRAMFRGTALQRELTKPLFVLRNLSDREALARMEAVDRFMAEMPGYPGRFSVQLIGRLIQRLELARGKVRLSDHDVVDLGHVRARVLLVGSPTDVIAPAPAVAAGEQVFTGAESVRFEEVPGSHLGIVAGPGARESSWALLADFLSAPAD